MTARDIGQLRLPPSVLDAIGQIRDRVSVHGLYDEVGSPIYHSWRDADPEIQTLVALLRPVRGPILELAAGSGRLTMALLSRRKVVTALDNSEHMLALLTDELAKANSFIRENCSVVHADMSDFALAKKFEAIVLNATSVTLLEPPERKTLYNSALKHLTPDGTFILNTSEILPNTDRIRHFRIKSGDREHDLYQHYFEGGSHRTVTVVPADLTAKKVEILVSRVRVLSPELLSEELVEAGFEVTVMKQWEDGHFRNTVLGASI